MAKKKINPARRRTKEEQRADYRKELAARQVTATTETEETKIPIVEELDGTDKIAPIEQAPMLGEPKVAGFKLTKTHYIISIIVGIIAILVFLGNIVYDHASLKERLNHTNACLTELKQTINERINRIEERIDKYISKEKTR